MPSMKTKPGTMDSQRRRAALLRLLSGLPDDIAVERHYHPDAEMFLVGRASLAGSGEWTGLRPARSRRWMSLNRPPYYWMRPAVGKARSSKLDLSAVSESQLLLLQTGRRRFVLLLPLVAGDVRATLSADTSQPGTLRLSWTGPVSASPEVTPVVLVAEGREPYALLHACMELLREQLGTFRLAHEKPFLVPDTLGWCTWDAFYHDVSAEKVLEGLESFRKAAIPIGWCILDDGWLNHDGERLLTFSPDPRKFPNGLRGVIRTAKERDLVTSFGVWHTLQGYWCGIHPDGELGRSYRTISNTGNIRPWNPRDHHTLSLIHPDDAHRFYADFYTFLREQGVDLVKVDGQAATEVFTHGVLPRVTTARRLQHAAQAAALLHFQGRLLHCMAHASDVLFHLLGTSLFRNSDDFFPKRPNSHGRHIFENALNAFLTHTVATPDWDMFWSAHPEAAFHAAARALSGGPVYVSDPPGQHDPTLLRALLDDRGHLLMPDRTALPTVDSLFRDACGGEALLFLTNSTGGGHLLVGAFNCTTRPEQAVRTPRPLGGFVCPADVPEYAGGPVIAWLHRADTTHVLRNGDMPVRLTLAPLEWEIVTFAPLLAGKLAALGLSGKLLGAAAINAQASLGNDAAIFHFDSGGTAEFYAARPPRQVDIDGLTHHKPRPAEVRYDRRRKRLTVELPPMTACNVVIRM